MVHGSESSFNIYRALKETFEARIVFSAKAPIRIHLIMPQDSYAQLVLLTEIRNFELEKS